MHERAGVSRAVGQVVVAADGRPVRRVELAVGPGMVEEVTAGIFEEVAMGTPAEGAELIMRRSRDTLSCLVCGSDYEGSKLDRCPECDGQGLVVEPAADIAVLDVVVAR